jgi:hypothetical protein
MTLVLFSTYWALSSRMGADAWRICRFVSRDIQREELGRGCAELVDSLHKIRPEGSNQGIAMCDDSFDSLFRLHVVVVVRLTMRRPAIVGLFSWESHSLAVESSNSNSASARITRPWRAIIVSTGTMLQRVNVEVCCVQQMKYCGVAVMGFWQCVLLDFGPRFDNR